MSKLSAAYVRKLLEKATPGPWYMEHASKAPPGEEWGEVVASLHPAGGAGRPVPGMRLTWSRRSVGVVAEHNAALISAAPDIAAAYIDAIAERDALRADLDKANDRLAEAEDLIRGALEEFAWENDDGKRDLEVAAARKWLGVSDG